VVIWVTLFLEEREIFMSSNKRLPGPSLIACLIGLLKNKNNFLSLLKEQAEIYGDSFQAASFTNKIFFFKHPDQIREIFIDKRDCFHNAFDKMRYFLGDGLITSEGDEWKTQRQQIQPLFSHENLMTFASVMEDECQKMIKRWESKLCDQLELDISEEFLFVSMNIASRAFFSMEIYETAPQIKELLDIFMDYAADGVRYPAFVSKLPTAKNRKVAAVKESVDQLLYALINKRRFLHEKGESQTNDMVDALILARDAETNATLTDKNIRDQLITFLIVGHETTANLLTWTLYLLTQNPFAANQIREEVAKLPTQFTITPKASLNLQYTMRVYQESLRLYPPAWIQTRKSIKECTIGDVNIPTGSRIIVSSYLTHRHPDFWRDPETFNPDRFLEEKTLKGAYFPFGIGPRSCIGQYFAQMVYQTFIPQLLKRYSFELAQNEIQLDSRVTLRPMGGLWLRISRS
jgi:cytochrome P450